jgi:glucose-1-phosphate thymidylyltransferase
MGKCDKNHSETQLPLLGLIPAGGFGRRLAPLPCSKEILPLGFYNSSEKGEARPKVACHYLLDSMCEAGVQKAFVVLGPGKWDIPAYFGNGKAVGIHLAYLIRDLPFGVPFTLDCAFPFIDNCNIAYGFPDILIRPKSAFRKIADKQRVTKADLVLGLFPTEHLHKWDLVELGKSGMVQRIAPRPHKGTAGYTWCIAVWAPSFSQFLHRFIGDELETRQDVEAFKCKDEIDLGTVFQAAIDRGLSVEHVQFKEGFCLDIGTPEDLKRALHLHFGMSKG